MPTKSADARIQQHIANLVDPDSVVSSRAERYLIRWYGVRALQPLLEACSHPLPQVRFRAAWTLGYIQDPRAYEPILRLLDDPEPSVRYDAAISLGVLGDARGIAPLLALVCQAPREDGLDGGAAMGLTRMGEPVVSALIEALQSAPSHAKMTIAYVLGHIRSENAIATLLKLKEDADENVRIAATEACEQAMEEKSRSHRYCVEHLNYAAGCCIISRQNK